MQYVALLSKSTKSICSPLPCITQVSIHSHVAKIVNILTFFTCKEKKSATRSVMSPFDKSRSILLQMIKQLRLFPLCEQHYQRISKLYDLQAWKRVSCSEINMWLQSQDLLKMQKRPHGYVFPQNICTSVRLL